MKQNKNFNKFGTYEKFNIPQNWERKKIKHLFFIGRGRVISQEDVCSEEKYPVFSSQTQNNGCLGYISTFDYNCTQLTWTTDGANAGTVFIREGKHNCTNVCGTLLPRTNSISITFASFSLNHFCQFHKRPDTNGAKIMNSEMAEITIIFPDTKKQIEIAKFLTYEEEKTKNLIQKQQQLIELLKEKRQAVISHAVTKGLNPDIPMKDSGVEWLGKISQNMILLKLKYATSLTIDKKITNSIFIGLENISSNNGKYTGVDDIPFDHSAISFENGNVLFGKLRPYLAKVWLAEFSGNCSSEFFVLKAIKVSNKYLKHYLLTTEFIQRINSASYGSQMPRVNWEFFGEQPITICTEEESIKISFYLDELTVKIDTLIQKQLQQIDLLKERRTALISAAVTGKIDLRDWTLPASSAETSLTTEEATA